MEDRTSRPQFPITFALGSALFLSLISILSACYPADEENKLGRRLETNEGSGSVYSIPKSEWIDRVTFISYGTVEEAFACADREGNDTCIDIGIDERETRVTIDYDVLKKWAGASQLGGKLAIYHIHLSQNEKFANLEITEPPSIGDFATSEELASILGSKFNIETAVVGPYGYWTFSAVPGGIYNDFDATKTRKEQFKEYESFRNQVEKCLTKREAIAFIESQLFALACRCFEMQYHPR